MQITRQADYALRAMLYLARPDTKKPVATHEIAKEQEIPASFLAKIISQLSIAGLIETSRGAKGGVKIKRQPEDISLLDVIEAIDGPIVIEDCTLDPSTCAFGDKCPIHDVFTEAREEIVRKFKESTFDKLIEMEQAKAHNQS